jgi:ketosteroid isomerase-like protein
MKRKNTFFVIHLLAMSALICNCNAQQSKGSSSLEEARREITKSNGIYFQAFAKRDSSILIGRYTEDCWIMPPNTSTLSGVDAPLDFFQEVYYKAGVRNGKLITTDVYGDGKEFATETGLYQFINAKNEIIENGTFLVLWKNTKDGWKMFRGSFSHNQIRN